jgi:hypothetical protein
MGPHARDLAGDRPLRVLLFVSRARAAMGGGALAMFGVAERLAARGHDLRVMARHTESRRVRGHVVKRAPDRDLFEWADVVLTTPEIASGWKGRSRRGAPVVCFNHSAVGQRWRPDEPKCALMVWASAALRTAAYAAGYSGPAPDMVQWPTIDPARFRTTPGDCVTLVNLLPEKGAGLFWSLAERMPDVPFLAVRGGWGRDSQVIPARIPANVTVLRYQADAREVYRRTRVLLYPRSAAAGGTWLNGVGMAALEAACSGIPTVAYPGPGLVESLGDAGNWCESFDPAAWESAIRSVLADWPARSAAALACASVLDPEGQTDEMEAAMRAIARSREVAPC